MAAVVAGAALITLGLTSIFMGGGPLVALAATVALPISLLASVAIILGTTLVAAPVVTYMTYKFFTNPKGTPETSGTPGASALDETPAPL